MCTYKTFCSIKTPSPFLSSFTPYSLHLHPVTYTIPSPSLPLLSNLLPLHRSFPFPYRCPPPIPFYSFPSSPLSIHTYFLLFLPFFPFTNLSFFPYSSAAYSHLYNYTFLPPSPFPSSFSLSHHHASFTPFSFSSSVLISIIFLCFLFYHFPTLLNRFS